MAENNSSYIVGETYFLDVDTLKPNPDQSRKYFDEESIKVLAETIKEDGLLQSISFTTHNDELIIVGGERRWRAIKLLKEQGVTIELTGKYVEGSLRKLAFVENLFREDMTAVEFAESVHALENEDKELTQGAIGQLLGLKAYSNAIDSFTKADQQVKTDFASFIPTAKEPTNDFSKILSSSLEKVNNLQSERSAMITSFASGENQNVHELMISMQKAGLAMNMTAAVRNKVMEAYKELTRMQF